MILDVGGCERRFRIVLRARVWYHACKEGKGFSMGGSSWGDKMGFARELAGFSLQLTLVPIAQRLAQDVHSGVGGDAALVSFLAAFMVCAVVLVWALRSKEGVRLLGKRLSAALAMVAPVFAGALVLLLSKAAGFESGAYAVAAFALLGCGSASAFVLWEKALSAYDGQHLAAMIAVWLLAGSVSCWLATGMDMLSSFVFATVAISASALLRPAAAQSAPADKTHSLLVVLTVRRYLVRHCLAFALLGFVTAAMTFLSMFASADMSLRFDFRWLLVGFVAALAILFVPAIFTKSLHPFVSFSLLMIPGAVAFFPVNPGSELSYLVLVCCLQIWFVCLFGASALVFARVDRSLESVGFGSVGLGIASLALGGFLGMLLFSPSWWQGALAPGSSSGIANAGVIGMCAIVCVYVSTNLLVNGRAFRAAVLIARGRMPASLSYARNIDRDEVHPQSDQDRQRACYDLAMERGLSPRELEVLMLLAQGHGLKRV